MPKYWKYNLHNFEVCFSILSYFLKVQCLLDKLVFILLAYYFFMPKYWKFNLYNFEVSFSILSYFLKVQCFLNKFDFIF